MRQGIRLHVSTDPHKDGDQEPTQMPSLRRGSFSGTDHAVGAWALVPSFRGLALETAEAPVAAVSTRAEITKSPHSECTAGPSWQTKRSTEQHRTLQPSLGGSVG